MEGRSTKMIDGVVAKALHRIMDARGGLMEIFRNDSLMFENFGQCYISETFPGIVKAWHCHEHQTDFICCVSGIVEVGLWDGREDSSTYDETSSMVIGDPCPMLIRIPEGVWHGWKCLHDKMSVVLNIPTRTYNHTSPDELRRPWNDQRIDYDWDVRGG